MVYKMVIKVDGGCRNNGKANPVAAAAGCRVYRGGRRYTHRTRRLPRHPTPTNQRAELLAVVLALEWALERNETLHLATYLQVTVQTDSRYAHGCMTEWVDKWLCNGWTNARGLAVANQDLLKRAVELEDRITAGGGRVEYVWIPREQNELADQHCNEEMDAQEDESQGGYYSNSDDPLSPRYLLGFALY